MDFTAMQFNQFLCDGEPEPSPSRGLIEFVKNRKKPVGWNAVPGVAHRDPHRELVDTGNTAVDPHPDRAAFCTLDRVADQARKDLAYAERIAHDLRGNFRGHFQPKLDPVARLRGLVRLYAFHGRGS